MLPCFPFLFENTENILFIDGEWCAQYVLPRWSRRYSYAAAKTPLKMCHTLKHLFIGNTFSCWLVLLSFLHIELALVWCRNPDNAHCFGTVFPNLIFVFCINLRRPSGRHAIRSIQKLLNCQTTHWMPLPVPLGSSRWGTKNSAVALSSRNDMISTKSPASRLFAQPFVQALIKENIKAPRHWPLWSWREFTGDQCIPRTRGQ